MSFSELHAKVSAAMGREAPIADVGELGRFAVEGACARHFVIARQLDATAELLHRRAEAIRDGVLPPPYRLGV
jgi:hypothetical protein